MAKLFNTTWILDDGGYEFSLIGSTSNKLSDLPKVHINFVSNGISYTGIDSIYLPFSSPINTVSGLIGVSKIDFPFGDTIDMNSGAIVYVISDSEGAFVPYYINKWINNNYKTINITGGEDANNTVVSFVITEIINKAKQINVLIPNFLLSLLLTKICVIFAQVAKWTLFLANYYIYLIFSSH